MHAQRLGQTGEHIAMAQRFVTRRVKQSVLGLEFGVPAPEERIIVATLQRMYRHFYFRVCDMVNIAALVESGAVDFVELHRAASMGGIWKGVCSLLRIVSDYVLSIVARPSCLPSEVLSDALFGGEKSTSKRVSFACPFCRSARGSTPRSSLPQRSVAILPEPCASRCFPTSPRPRPSATNLPEAIKESGSSATAVE